MKPAQRIDNWPAALALFIEEKRAQPFDWRQNNCAFFACDWLAILVRVDPAKPYRRRCTSAVSAARLLRAGSGLVALASEDFARRGWPEVPPARARRGDVATTTTPQGEALGVVIGAQVAHAGPNGLVFTPLANCRRAWRIA